MPTPDPSTPTHVVARIGKPHGLRGEVTVQVHIDDPEAVLEVGSSFATEPVPAGPLALASVRVHQGVFLLGFTGVADRTAAEGLRGVRLVAPVPEESEDSGEGWFEEELMGFTVTLPDGTVVGTVGALHTRPVQDLLEVALQAGGSALVPFVEEIVTVVDEESRTVVIDPPPGLLDLTAGD